MIITERAKAEFYKLKTRTNCDTVKLVTTELDHRRWLLLQCFNTATDTITYFAPFLCPANLDTATLDHDGKKFVIREN